MKPAKREAVDRENVTVFGREPVAEMAQRVGIDQLAGSFVAQAQPNREWPIAANAVAHRQGVILQRREGLRPIFARMNVRAVSEMSAAVELHRFSLTDGELRCLAQEAQRIPVNEAVNRLF